MKVQNSWMVVDGILGTGHMARDGRVADFRPAKITLEKRGWQGSLVGANPQIRLRAGDGWVEDMILPAKAGAPTRVESPDGLEFLYKQEVEADFGGVKVSATHSWREFTPAGLERQEAERSRSAVETKARSAAAVAAKEAAWQAALDAMEEWVEQRIADPLAGLTAREVGLCLRKPSRAAWAQGAIIDRWLAFPVPEGLNHRKFVLGWFRRKSASDEEGAGGKMIRELVLAAHAAKRAARRAAVVPPAEPCRLCGDTGNDPNLFGDGAWLPRCRGCGKEATE